MGGRANPLRDAAAIVNTGQTGFAEDASEVDGLTSFTLKTRDEVATTGRGAA
jgi:hypothetical protein